MSSNHRHQSKHVVMLVFFAALTGCHHSSLELAPVHGQVMFGGKPMFKGKVMFAPIAKGDDVNPGKPAWGKLQSDGTFRLTTYKKNDGAVVGEHWVTIMNSDEELPEGVPEFSRLMVPKKATVVTGKDNDFNFAFSSDDVKKFREDNH